MKIRQYQIDAFTQRVFGGNPAAVCPLDAWLDDDLLQKIAAENNLSETAFFVRSERGYRLRWFTPVAEVNLCGHATLAAAHVLFEIIGHPDREIVFETRSGILTVARRENLLVMNFPSTPPVPCAAPDALIAGLGIEPCEVLEADDYFAVFENEDIVRSLRPDFARLATLGLRGVIATSPGRDVDFVSRFFAPKFGIAEDPVTGSAHCALTPYWSQRLGKRALNARQVSTRGGDILCELDGERVMLAGHAVRFMEAEIFI